MLSHEVRSITIRIGLIGYGYMGECFSLALSNVQQLYPELPTLRLVGLCDSDQAKLSVAKRQGNFESYHTNWRSFLSESDVDVIIIATPNSFHKEIAIDALQRQIHVLCEKPMAVELEDALAMTQAARSSTAKTLLGYSYIRNPAIKHMKKLIDDGTIGRVTSFRGHFAEDYSADENTPHSWRCLRSKSGLGALGDLGCHVVSLAQYLVGEISAVSALTEIIHTERPVHNSNSETAKVTNEDFAAALVRFEEGISGTIDVSRIAWGSKNRLLIEVQGTHGAIRFDQERMNELQFFDARAEASMQGFKNILTAPEHPPYGRFIPSAGHQLGFVDLKTIEIGEFLLEICGVSTARPNFEDGLKIEKTIHAIADSSRDRRWVSINV